jgi:DNA (cytosine-5)-methyltransferase 1
MEVTIKRKSKSVAKFVSLYSGAGGMDIGFYKAGFEPIWANDIDPVAVETYNQLFPSHLAVAGDIRNQEIPGRGAAELVVGGPPCQGFSVAGKMDPDDPRSRHVFDFLDITARIKPKAFVMENVKALASNARWREVIEDLMSKAKSIGYKPKLLLLNAAEFGVPQARERMFLVGVKSRAEVEPITPTYKTIPTVRSALENLAPYGTPGNNTKCKAKITPAKKPVLRKSPFAGMLFNGQGRPLDLERPALTLPASMGGNRTPIVDQRQLETGEESWVVRYHKHLMSGGKPASKVPSCLRRVSVEEAASLQTFPMGMKFSGKQSAQYRQIGNAVPPNLAFHVALSVRKAIGL